jgi:hypothetical protein
VIVPVACVDICLIFVYFQLCMYVPLCLALPVGSAYLILALEDDVIKALHTSIHHDAQSTMSRPQHMLHVSLAGATV